MTNASIPAPSDDLHRIIEPAARTVRDFIEKLRSEGRTTLLTTHNLDEGDCGASLRTGGGSVQVRL